MVFSDLCVCVCVSKKQENSVSEIPIEDTNFFILIQTVPLGHIYLQERMVKETEITVLNQS